MLSSSMLHIIVESEEGRALGVLSVHAPGHLLTAGLQAQFFITLIFSVFPKLAVLVAFFVLTF